MEGLGRDLATLTYDQLVLVLADGSACRVYAYDKGEGGIWVKALGFSGFVGEKGVSSAKREGDKRTPAGIFRLGFAFGSEETPNPDYPFRAVTQESFWVDDPDSRFYNQWVEGEAEARLVLRRAARKQPHGLRPCGRCGSTTTARRRSRARARRSSCTWGTSPPPAASRWRRRT